MLFDLEAAREHLDRALELDDDPTLTLWTNRLDPALLEGRAGGDKRTGSQRGLHNQGAEAEAADQPVAAREVRCQRCRPGRKFSYQGAVLRDPVSEIPVAGGVDPIQAGAGYRQCSAPCLDCALMSRAVDPGSQAAGNRQAEGCQMCGEFTRQRPAGMSGVAAAYDRKLRLRQIIPVAAHEQQCQWIDNLLEKGRIRGIVEMHDMVTGLRQPVHVPINGRPVGCEQVVDAGRRDAGRR